jgi:hypothetical protein
MSNNSIIEHRANYYFVEFREEFLIICINCTYKREGKKSVASAHCKALILAILENWTNNKRGKKEDIAIFMTYQQWIDSMYGMFGRTVIIDSLDELLGDGLLSKEPYKMFGKNTYKYILNCKELNNRLRQLPERGIQDVHPKVDTSKKDTRSKMDASKIEPDTSKIERVTHSKMDDDPSKIEYNIESTQKHNIETQREKTNVAQKSPTSPGPSVLSPSLSSQKSLSQETKPTEVGYPLFDCLCHQKGYASEFKVPHNEKNDTAIQELRSQGATPEQVEFVFNDIWNDKDPFWQQHRGKLSTVASQFTARVWKMSQAAPKRQTLTGTPNYTEDRIGQTAQEAKPTLHIVKPEPQPTYGPKLDQTPAYTRLKIEKPARARSLQARLQQEQAEK